MDPQVFERAAIAAMQTLIELAEREGWNYNTKYDSVAERACDYARALAIEVPSVLEAEG